jgi:hypothetical protein
VISGLHAANRRDLHNSSTDFVAAMAGYSAFTHLASGRVCLLPYEHRKDCHFVIPPGGDSKHCVRNNDRGDS